VIFTLEVDGKRLLAFEASSESNARGFIELDEFRDDLALLTSNGTPVCAYESQFAVRRASDHEVDIYRCASKTSAQDEAPTFVFLVHVDGLILHVIDPDQ
jgi:hypothetical protein